MELTEWHVGEKMHEMQKLRQEILKTMARKEFQQKERETFAAVHNFLKELKNVPCNICFKKPWIFYGVYSFEKCIEILINECTMSERGEKK